MTPAIVETARSHHVSFPKTNHASVGFNAVASDFKSSLDLWWSLTADPDMTESSLGLQQYVETFSVKFDTNPSFQNVQAQKQSQVSFPHL